MLEIKQNIIHKVYYHFFSTRLQYFQNLYYNIGIIRDSATGAV